VDLVEVDAVDAKPFQALLGLDAEGVGVEGAPSRRWARP
jgi:hypothetical protein